MLNRQGFLAATIIVILGLTAACSDDDGDDTSSPSATETPLSTPTDTPEPLSSLDEVLGNGEFLAVRPVARPTLVYAVKVGREVTVLERDIVNGVEQEILEYAEFFEALHSGNTWREQPPGATLSTDRGVLVYTSVDGVLTFDLNGRESKVLAAALEDQTQTDPAPPLSLRDERGRDVVLWLWIGGTEGISRCLQGRSHLTAV